jgi:hypothetical protein
MLPAVLVAVALVWIGIWIAVRMERGMGIERGIGEKAESVKDHPDPG